jgi:hypothetical protein
MIKALLLVLSLIMTAGIPCAAGVRGCRSMNVRISTGLVHYLADQYDLASDILVEDDGLVGAAVFEGFYSMCLHQHDP